MKWLLEHRVGPLPLLLFLPLFATVALLCLAGRLGTDVLSMLGALAVGGYLCAWIGATVPLLSRVGGPALVAAFLPSYLVYRGWLPSGVVSSVTQFTKESQFIYLYVTAIVVGSILSLDRKVLLRGAARVFPPLLAGSLLACVLVPVLGMAIHVAPGESLAMIVAPITGGGVGEGAIPLSAGYAEIAHADASAYLSRILPIVLMANMFAIVLGGLLKLLGQLRPEWSGNGEFGHGDGVEGNDGVVARQPELLDLVDGLMFGVMLYLCGAVLHVITPFPAAVTMLLLAVALRALDLVPKRICVAATMVGRITAVAVTHPLLFAVAVALTPWVAVRDAFQFTTVTLVLATVFILAATGLVLGRFVGLHPIESALVNVCHTGSGGTGDVAILSAADRLELMPFAQIATRIGGALTVSAALLLFRYLHGAHS